MRKAGPLIHILVDHLPSSSSTHRSWWNHIEEGLIANGQRVCRASSNLDPRTIPSSGEPRVFWYFTESSLNPTLSRVLNARDVVLTWSGLARFREVSFNAFQLGYPGELWMREFVEGGGGKESDVITFQPFAPLSLLRPRGFLTGLRERALTSAVFRKRVYDFSFFGTIWESNYDQFENILQALAHRYRCLYRGLYYNVPPAVGKYGFSRTLVPEKVGIQTLLKGRINLAISHIAHRRKRSVTERVFISCALGKPVVADNAGVRDFFEEDEVTVCTEAEEYLDRCGFLIHHWEATQKMADRACAKTRQQYTYKETISGVLSQLLERI